MRRPLLGLLLASTVLASTSLPARPALADPPPAPLVPSGAPPSYSPAPAAPWAAPLAGTRRRSSGAMIGGIFLTSLGALGMAVGTGFYVDAAAGCSRDFDFDIGSGRLGCSSSDGKLVGMTLLLGSAVGAAIGVPLWIYGAEKTVIPPGEQPLMREVSVRVGPASAALHVSF